MKEKIIGLEKALRKKQNPNDKLMSICREEFLVKQDISKLGNDIFRLKNEKLKLHNKIADLEKEKDTIFISLGLKKVEVLE